MSQQTGGTGGRYAERLITTHSGEFDWPGRNAAVALYVYDKNGDLMDRENLPRIKPDSDGGIKITVPENGLVIAEIRDDAK